MSGIMHSRRAVTLISGASVEARSSCIQQMLAASPHEGHAVWLRTGEAPSSQALMPSSLPAAGAVGAGSTPDQVMVGGCICCLAGPVFRTTLVRLLRQPGWQHLILELPRQDPAHLLKVIDQLRSPPFDQYLRLVDVVEVLDQVDAGVADWASASFRPQETGWQWCYRDPLGEQDGVLAVAADAAADTVVLFRRWPAEADRPSRQAVQQALTGLLATPGVLSLRAVLQSHRSAYDWSWPDPGTGAGSPATQAALDPAGQNLSAVLRSRETVWRLDNRIRLRLAQGTDMALLSAGLSALKACWMSDPASDTRASP